MRNDDSSASHVGVEVQPHQGLPSTSSLTSTGQAEQDPQAIDESIKDEFTCTICLEILNQAQGLECGHKFCNPCISKWMDGGKRTCPNCQHHISRPPINEWGINNYLAKMKAKMPKERVPQRDELPVERRHNDRVMLHYTLHYTTNGCLNDFNSMMDRVQAPPVSTQTSSQVTGALTSDPTLTSTQISTRRDAIFPSQS